MPVVGTAGHVDHGKSTLIQNITGRNPDRWAEERERGLTIDLGFGWVTLPDGTEVSFVDVPGHEKFLKNMLAGIEAIDVALFVVAADEGWMPQSEEHLAVLDLLEIDRGVVAVTKADSVEPDLLELALAETAEQLKGTHLEAAPVMAVSGVTGQGVPELLKALAATLPAPPEGDRPRLWIDRSFAVPGAGTIVTGTLQDGSLSVDDRVVIYPAGRSARIRGIQSHERAHDTVGPGRRVALNLGGVDHDQIERGDMVGLDDQWVATDRFAVVVRPARFVDELSQRGAYQLHIGSSAHRVYIRGLEEGYAVFQTDRAMPLAVGDRFILRDTGRKLVVGGGRILDPSPGRTRRALRSAARIDPTSSPNELASALLALRGRDTLTRLAAQSGGGKPQETVIVGDEAVTRTRFDELTARSVELIREEHGRHPLRPGLPLATLAERIGVSSSTLAAMVDESVDLVRHGPDIAAEDHVPRLTAEQEEAWRGARGRLAESLSVPVESELGLETDLVAFKIRTGELVRVSPELVYLPEQIGEIKTLLNAIDGEFTVADFRDHAGLTRKYAVPVLEWTDKEGLTVRRGDVRRLR
ncbi:MAG TPA: selenocysteine-specific translation elongation factor [Acidimicrobiia bacterium]|jgi:selenocysteine-specific elongation factor|nr:selenocysteine-specific translation elongation factor [Acidimicrobiia bacterium]